jgi:uncharacterized protein YndB with AHSA1/START domain|nr:SRPBCC domain-containing protein [Kofleriaceae bacterium]
MNLTTLEFTRRIPAEPAEVFDVWIDPHHPGGPWFSPQTDKQQSKIIFDAKVDGLFFHGVTAGGHSWAHYGRFTRLERGAIAEHTWVCEATQGRESVVTTTFVAQDGGTLVTITQTGVPDDEPGRAQSNGWKWILGALADAIAKKSGAST